MRIEPQAFSCWAYWRDLQEVILLIPRVTSGIPWRQKQAHLAPSPSTEQPSHVCGSGLVVCRLQRPVSMLSVTAIDRHSMQRSWSHGSAKSCRSDWQRDHTRVQFILFRTFIGATYLCPKVAVAPVGMNRCGKPFDADRRMPCQPRNHHPRDFLRGFNLSLC